ncbi:3'-5' exonuclease [Hymenobacter properus]|uniref:3'-5' exonuclease n=1 Tax=Hymenobacter properus TaxID=2791026 RepID=A0A931FLM0_9BACT|nr:3'-5' exonuclease [Hymenobacter properus]MBF9140819.1 3'-5' exonuclease [Hymenobacter properus]MBR7719628.1 3'-5' exonuclease [Microvirga sp. SRT04]
MLNNLIVFDFETTGLNPFTDHVTEIAAVRLRGGREVGSFHTLVAFGGEVPADITKLTGITTELCAKGLPPRTAFALLRNFIGADVLVAHNAAFDVAYLEQMYARLGASGGVSNDFLCTKTLAVACVHPAPANYRLGTLCQHFEIELTGAHRAMNDVRATAKLLDLLRATYNEEGTAALLNCCGMGPKHHPQRGLPAHAKPIVQ